MIRLYTLTSDLHREMTACAADEPFIQAIQNALGEAFIYRGEDYSDYGSGDAMDLIYVRTGGTEGLFLKEFRPDWMKVRLLASGESNSLAASMEILSFLNRNGLSGEILHGTPQEIAARLKGSASCPSADFIKPLHPSKILAGTRYGVIGKPSDWLISSDVDYAKAKEVLGAELIDIPIEELVSIWKESAATATEFRTAEWKEPSANSALADSPCRYAANALKPLNVPKYGNPISEAAFEKAVRVYKALCTIIDKYKLNGLTLRCFDLLTSIGTTGCLGLALLNSQGIVATCEGDVPAMLSMAVAQRVTGTPGFQVNLSRITGDDLLFAHCTVPLNIVRDYCYDTHFESGIGVAVHGEFTEGPMTLFKIGAKLDNFVAEDVTLTANQYGDNLCRTQVHIQGPGLSGYLLRNPLGNHHILLPGHHAKDLSR
ncbi:MAG: hypothetical protein IJK20_03925 [Bacteroidales bacterium]|nr:hypothetical protein [Bacteroidales bacterium]